MNLAQARKGLDKLKKIRELIEVSKLTTIYEISHVSKVSQNALEISAVAKAIFENAHQRFRLTSPYITTNNHDGNTLYIYVSFPKSLLATSYDSQEKQLLEQFKRDNDKLIVIGDIAYQFALKNNLPIELFIESADAVGIDKVATAIVHNYGEQLVSSVRFILHTSRTNNSTITILPINKLDVAFNNINHYGSIGCFYPSVAESMENLTRAYVAHCTTAIFYEAQYFHLKERLIRHEESLRSVDERIRERWLDLVKTQRKIQTEELIMISQNAKREIKEQKQDDEGDYA